MTFVGFVRWAVMRFDRVLSSAAFVSTRMGVWKAADTTADVSFCFFNHRLSARGVSLFLSLLDENRGGGGGNHSFE